MAADAATYAVLGLEPGADRAAVERAYKELIKQHHPDREGGDSSRAAEINRAYRELRGRAVKDPLEFNDELVSRRRAGRFWAIGVGTFVAGAAALLLTAGPQRPPMSLAAGRAAPASPDPIGQPLNLTDIDLATRQAFHLARTRDEMALTQASRDCQRAFRDNPGPPLLDRCAAFDDAVVQLQDRDPLRDQGPFATLAVTGRQWSAATGLSNDYLAIDSRLDQIRLRVELTLAPQLEPAIAATNVQRVAAANAEPPPCGAAAGEPSGC